MTDAIKEYIAAREAWVQASKEESQSKIKVMNARSRFMRAKGELRADEEALVELT